MLMKPTYTPDIDVNLRYSDVNGQEVATGGGYSAGGKSLTGKSVSYDAAANEYNLLAADLSWGPGATFQTRYGVVFEWDTTDKFLWALLDFGDIVVHVFYHPVREFYDLEGLWIDAPRVPVDVPADSRVQVDEMYGT